MEAAGIEPENTDNKRVVSATKRAHPEGDDNGDATDSDDSPTSREDPLEESVRLAARAGRWDVVAQLARELEARRLAAEGVVRLDPSRKRKPT